MDGSDRIERSPTPSPSPRGTSEPRFPFGDFPRGWFVVALSDELAPGAPPLSLHYFGRDLVAFRGASGRAFVTGAYCPHLGAHLGHGGCVEGDTIRCPFHGWRFEGDGRCAGIPYSEHAPPRARLEAYPVREQNGVVHVFFDPSGGEPWELPVLDEEGYTKGRSVHWRALRTHAQEVFENTVDTAHIGPVHGGRGARLVHPPKRDGERMVCEVEFQAPGDIVGMPGTLNDVHLLVTLRGLGHVVVETHVRNAGVRARQRIYATPVDHETIDIRGIVHVRETEDAAFTAELHDLFYRAYVEDFARDFPIWENKRYLARPAIAKGDGPIGVYRHWCEQFYAGAKGAAETTAVRGERPTETAASQAASEQGNPHVPVWALRAKRALSPAASRARTWAGAVRDRALSALASRNRGTDPAPRDDAAERRSAAHVEARGPVSAPAAPDAAETRVQGSPPVPPARATPAAGPRRIASAHEYFETLPARFVPDAARDVDAVFQWELGGPEGETFHALVRGGHIDVRPGAHERPTVALVMAADDYVRVVNGELDGTWAFSSGRGKVRGSLAAAMKMRSLFPA